MFLGLVVFSEETYKLLILGYIVVKDLLTQ